MIMSVLPLKKLRRNSRYLFGLILVAGVVAVVHEFVAANTWSNHSRECVCVCVLCVCVYVCVSVCSVCVCVCVCVWGGGGCNRLHETSVRLFVNAQRGVRNTHTHPCWTL